MFLNKILSTFVFCVGLYSGLYAHCGTSFCPVYSAYSNSDLSFFRFSVAADNAVLEQEASGTQIMAASGHQLSQKVLLQADFPIFAAAQLSLQVPLQRTQVDHDGSGNPAEQWDFSGLGDAALRGRIPVLGNFQAWGGIEAPTGRSDLINSVGIVADRTVQLGSGTWDLLWGVDAAQTFTWKALDGGVLEGLLFAGISHRNNGTDASGYHPGDEWLVNAGIQVPVWSVCLLEAQFNAQHGEQAFGPGVATDDTGGSKLLGAAGTRLQLGGQEIHAFWQWPLFQRLNGTQLTSALQVRVGSEFVV